MHKYALKMYALLLFLLTFEFADGFFTRNQEVNISRLVDFDYRMRVIYADVADPILSHTQAGQDLYDFHLAAGYESTSYSEIERAADSFSRESHLVYTCGTESFQRLAAVHVVGNQQHRRFSSTRLLTLLRNKQISFVGDSLSRQYYLDLAAELRPWQSYLQYGALPQVHTLVTDAKYELPASISKESINPSIKDETSIFLLDKDRFMRRYYASHNVTLLWCEDSKLTYFENYRFPQAGQNTTTKPEQGEHPSHCDLSALLDSDVLVLSVGAWYKPLFEASNVDFFEDLEQQQQRLRSAASNYRSLFKQHNRHGQSAIFLWTLMPHTGLIDEVIAPDSPLNHTLRASQSQTCTSVQAQKPILTSTLTSISMSSGQYSKNCANGWSSQNYSWLPEELARDGNNVDKMRFEIHGDGKMWSQLTMAAVYPPVYNQILRSIAREFRDEYLDMYRLSSLYLRHFSHGTPLPLHLPLPVSHYHNKTSKYTGRKITDTDTSWSPETLRRLPSIPSQEYHTFRNGRSSTSGIGEGNTSQQLDLRAVHVDSLHYCPGSVFRGALLLLQLAIENRCNLSTNHNHSIHHSHHTNKLVPHHNVKHNHHESPLS